MKKRYESSFGLHFDFHASPDSCSVVGATLKEEDLREICRLIRPDFLQIDCKGHPGWASYPTEFENPMPEFACDPLEMWRRVTREEDVALYMHYSGVIDNRYCKEHPEEAIVMADGTRSDSVTRTLGGYADNLLIPQMKELAGKYGVDGIWVDGECWGTCPDFHPDTVAAFEKEYGVKLDMLPSKPGAPYYQEYREFCRELFRRYLRHYIDAVHMEYPDFQIASNWAFTDHMPEKVCADVNFLSGDFNPWDSFNTARYAGRAIAQQNMPWDLMAWNFRHGMDKPAHLPKHPVQIMQEAASVLSLGGGFQNYIMQYPDGTPRMEQIRRMKPVADFVRARAPFCFGGKAVHEAAILLSTHDRSLETSSLYSRDGYQRTVGLNSLVCDIGRSVEIVCEHTLKGHSDDYKLIIIPELAFGLDSDMTRELLDYAANGGSLLLTGGNTCRFFAQAGLPVSFVPVNGHVCRFTDGDDAGALENALGISAKNTEVISLSGDSYRSADVPSSVVLSFGKGKIALVGADIGSQYGTCGQYFHRILMNRICDTLYAPMVRVDKVTGLLEVTVLRKDCKMFIQLVNANGNHKSTTVATEDFIPPVLDAEFSISLDRQPAALIQQPSGKELSFIYENGIAHTTISRVDIHEIIEIMNA